MENVFSTLKLAAGFNLGRLDQCRLADTFHASK
jgi:hypothetical protein